MNSVWVSCKYGLSCHFTNRVWHVYVILLQGISILEQSLPQIYHYQHITKSLLTNIVRYINANLGHSTLIYLAVIKCSMQNVLALIYTHSKIKLNRVKTCIYEVKLIKMQEKMCAKHLLYLYFCEYIPVRLKFCVWLY